MGKPMTLRFLMSALAAVIALFLAAPSVAVDGFDQPGGDYANFPATGWWHCRNTCAGDARCVAWTWVKPGVQGPAPRCYLKNIQPKLVANACCNSGSHRNIEPNQLQPEARTDRPGQDYRNFELTGSDGVNVCRATCDSEAACKAWTYVSPGLQGPKARCWLKRGIPFPIDNPSMVSGVKWRSIPQNID